METAKKLLLLFGEPLVWLLYDEFTTPESAPITSPRTCEPGPGVGVITDTTSKAPISGGDLVFNSADGAGDPGYWMRDAGPAEFTPLVGWAAFLDVTPTSPGGGDQLEFGFDVNTATFISNPYFKKVVNVLNAQNETGGVDIPIGSFTQNVETRLLLIPRSNNRKHHYVQDGKLRWVGSLEQSGMVNLGVSNIATTVCNIHKMGLIDLPANGYSGWDADFSTVTDSKSNPVNGVTYNADADLLLDATFTVENGQFIQWKFRYQDSSNYLFIDVNSSRVLMIRRRIGAGFTTLYTGGALTDSVEYNIKLVAEGTSIKLYLNNVLQGSGVTESTFLTETGGAIGTNYVARGVLSTHPYPALGIATDRIIAPQAADTATHTADCLIYGRGVTVPSSNSLQYETRKDGSDEITLDIDSNGKPIVKENGVARITGSNGDVTDGDDWGEILDGTDVSLFVGGVQIASTYSSLSLTGGTTFNMASIGTDGATDSVECFPRNVAPILPAALV